MHLDVPNKKMLTEVQIAQTRMMLLMTYNPSKTSYENISEQEKDNWLVRAAKTISPKGMEDYSQGSWTEIGEWIKTWDKHDWLGFLEIAATAVALTSPIGWVALGASGLALTFGGVNAAAYFQEGDNYMGGMTVFFSLIPGLQLAKQFKTIAKYGPERAFQAMKVVKAGKGTPLQKQIAKEVSEELGEKGNVVNKMMFEKLKSEFFNSIKQSGLKTKAALLAVAKKAGYAGLIGLSFAGSFYLWDTIYGLIGKNEKEIDEKSPLRALWKYVNQNPEKIEETADNQIETTEKATDTMEKLKSLQITMDPKLLDSLLSAPSVNKYKK